MESFLDLVQKFLDVFFYWAWVFWRALAATWSIVANKPIRNGFILLLTALVVTALAVYVRKPVMQELRSYLVAPVVILMFGFIVFVYELVVTPARIYEEQTRQIDKLDLRLQFAVGELPDRRLSDSEKERFKQIVSPFAPQDVIIEYMDEPRSRSPAVAQMLGKIFQSAGWKVTLNKATFEKITLNGMALRSSDSDLSKAQQAVLSALQAVNMRCAPRGFAGVDVPDKRVELVIGQL